MRLRLGASGAERLCALGAIGRFCAPSTSPLDAMVRHAIFLRYAVLACAAAVLPWTAAAAQGTQPSQPSSASEGLAVAVPTTVGAADYSPPGAVAQCHGRGATWRLRAAP